MEDDSYSVQHFSVSPRNVADSIYNIWFDYAERCLDALKISVRDREFADIPPDVLESTVEDVFNAMIVRMNKEVDELEKFLRQDILHIPPHVLLPEDEVHRNASRDPQAPSVASLKLQAEWVRKRLAEEGMRQQQLQAELAHQESVRKQLQDTLASVKAQHTAIVKAAATTEAAATAEAVATAVPSAS